MGEKKSMMGTCMRPQQGNLKLVFKLLNPMLGKPRIRLNNLKTSLRFPCLGFNTIIDSTQKVPTSRERFHLEGKQILICELLPIKPNFEGGQSGASFDSLVGNVVYAWFHFYQF